MAADENKHTGFDTLYWSQLVLLGLEGFSCFWISTVRGCWLGFELELVADDILISFNCKFGPRTVDPVFDTAFLFNTGARRKECRLVQF